MKHHHFVGITVCIAAASLLGTGCVKKANAGDGKIPLTTASEEAKAEYLQGRDLVEKLRLQNSIAHFEQALAKDPDFAMAYFQLAQVTPSANGFFDNMKKAVSLADKVSEGERLMILSFDAGVNANQPKQLEYAQKLVAAYPKDERAHFVLGNYYTAQQDFPLAAEQYEICTQIDSNYTPAFNSLGYSYRSQERYDDAARAFRKYMELIPDDPNPPDSYAELLMKMGKFDESITNYRKALSIDPNFINSRIGVAANLLYSGKPDEAAAELQKAYDMARNDGERRVALFNMTVLDVDGGKTDEALKELDRQYALGEKINDTPAMAGDLIFKGNILEEVGKYDDAQSMYTKAQKMMDESNLSQEVKDNAQLNTLFLTASVAIGKRDLKTARSETVQFRKGAEAIKNTFQMRQAHELAGRIALAEKKYDDAIAELRQSNQLNPYNLFRLSLAFQGKKDKENARAFCLKAVQNNTLPFLNYAFVRMKAAKMLAAM